MPKLQVLPNCRNLRETFMIYFFAMSKNGVLRNGEFIEKENMD